MWIKTEPRPRYERKPFVSNNANSSITAETTRPFWRRQYTFYCVISWTALVGLALWWLLRGHGGPSVWVVNQGGTAQPAGIQTFRSWFTADMGFQRIYPWILLGPYVALVALGFPLERGRLRLNLPLNLAACAMFLAACHTVNARIRPTLPNVTIVRIGSAPTGWQTNTLREVPSAGLTNVVGQLRQGFKSPPPPPKLPDLSLWSSLLDLLAYGAMAGLAHSVHFYRRFRERERRALLLESNLARARLDALRAQLQPHFLFNSLNAITALLRRDPRLAETTLLSLSELLRLALSLSEKQEIPLREEMEFVQRYLEIQQTRFGDKLRVEREIEPAALDCLVPTLLLQPLIENAIRHGIEPAENAGRVRLTARRRNEKLVLTVEDDGVGLTGCETASSGTGIGLANLHARLETLYGNGQTLELIPRPNGGVIVRIEIPWRLMANSETSGAADLL